MRALARGLKWAALGLTLAAGAGFGAFFFFLFEKEQQFWDAMDKSRPEIRVSVLEVPAALRESILFQTTEPERPCNCSAVMGQLRGALGGVADDSKVCRLEYFLIRQVMAEIWTKGPSKYFGLIVAACNLTSSLSADQILEEFLNRAYFGHGQIGIVSAAHFYYGKKPQELSIEEAAGLAGLFPFPDMYSPKTHPDRFTQRQAYVLRHLRRLPEFSTAK